MLLQYVIIQKVEDVKLTCDANTVLHPQIPNKYALMRAM